MRDNKKRLDKLEETLAPPGMKPVAEMSDQELYDIVCQDFDERYPRKDGRRWRHSDITTDIILTNPKLQADILRELAEGEVK